MTIRPWLLRNSHNPSPTKGGRRVTFNFNFNNQFSGNLS